MLFPRAPLHTKAGSQEAQQPLELLTFSEPSDLNATTHNHTSQNNAAGATTTCPRGLAQRPYHSWHVASLLNQGCSDLPFPSSSAFCAPGARKYSSGAGLSSLPIKRRADLMWLLNQENASLQFWLRTEEDISTDSMASGLLKPLIALRKEIAELQAILDDANEDEEMKNVAEEELEGQTQELARVKDELIDQLLPRDEADDSGCILEVRAGTGGDEAALFALEVFGMYESLARGKGWKFEVVDVNSTELKGCKEASAAISGRGAYGRFKYEIGVHRVQRVPVTEKSGRLHTSAISVAVLPEASEVDVQVRDEDLRIDTYRSGGAGGQSVNTTSSAVRVTHVPSGVVVAIQDERSQHKNKAKALKVLRARLYDMERQKLAASRSEQRSEQIGSGDRSERIRTYNFPQGRVTDHRVGITQHSLERVLATGELDDFVEALIQKQRQDAIAALIRTKQASMRH
ncbi:Peptide chain release factor 1 [Klebsormidium nitens]|uniref:Peptide chain release factor 1 n=1 Tax=Klebsormidium nitens TaxID=105231 RepID=A0A1Y1IQ48_KLENI|nr:Peptide chain release factor 1 [Klebsormidium nitens]|eukprot:GAQ90747.1 Peptide chain release factor 1 [Klebsormidium nitens]